MILFLPSVKTQMIRTMVVQWQKTLKHFKHWVNVSISVRRKKNFFSSRKLLFNHWIGKFIAESKFRSNPEEYIRLALVEDREKIDELLTNKAVEAQVLERLRRKALVYGQTLDEEQEGTSKHLRIPVEAVVDLYKRWVIPLTKVVEVDYLITRGKNAHAAKQAACNADTE